MSQHLAAWMHDSNKPYVRIHNIYFGGMNLRSAPSKYSWWQRLIQRASYTRFGAWLLPNTLQRLDQKVLQLTNGRKTLTQLLTGIPVVVLSTTGAKSGKSRTTPLLCNIDGDKVILYATYFGSQKHPAWYLNLRANPHVAITANGHQQEYIAREANEAERAQYWDKATQLFAGYGVYKNRVTNRKVPIIVLEPKIPNMD